MVSSAGSMKLPNILMPARHKSVSSQNLAMNPLTKNLSRVCASKKNVHLIDVPDNKSLGEWAGLCKIDKDGLPRKVVGASCVVITDFGEEGQAYDYMMKYLGKSS